MKIAVLRRWGSFAEMGCRTDSVYMQFHSKKRFSIETGGLPIKNRIQNTGEGPGATE